MDGGGGEHLNWNETRSQVEWTPRQDCGGNSCNKERMAEKVEAQKIRILCCIINILCWGGGGDGTEVQEMSDAGGRV